MKAAAIWKVCLFHWRGLGAFYFWFVFRIRHGTSRMLQILADAFLRQMEWGVGVGGTSPYELWFIKLGFGSLGPHQERYIYCILPWCQRSFTLSFLWELCAVMLCYVSVTLSKRLALSSLEFEWIQQYNRKYWVYPWQAGYHAIVIVKMQGLQFPDSHCLRIGSVSHV